VTSSNVSTLPLIYKIRYSTSSPIRLYHYMKGNTWRVHTGDENQETWLRCMLLTCSRGEDVMQTQRFIKSDAACLDVG